MSVCIVISCYFIVQPKLRSRKQDISVMPRFLIPFQISFFFNFSLPLTLTHPSASICAWCVPIDVNRFIIFQFSEQYRLSGSQPHVLQAHLQQSSQRLFVKLCFVAVVDVLFALILCCAVQKNLIFIDNAWHLASTKRNTNKKKLVTSFDGATAVC